MVDAPKVYVVDDDPAMRQSLRFLLESVGMEVDDFTSAEEFLERFDPEAPACLVADIRMPGMSGMLLQEQLRSRGSDIPIIVITGYGTVNTAVKALRQGAFDFLEKPVNDQLLLDRIQEAMASLREQRARRQAREEAGERFQELTPREEQVLELIVKGWSNRRIAEHLEVSEKTVEVHRARVMSKTHASNLAELVRLYLEVRPEQLENWHSDQ